MIVMEGKGLTGPHETEAVLRGLNLKTHTLRVVSTAKQAGDRGGGGLPICKIFNRAEEAAKKASELAARAEKEKQKGKQKYKIVEINWAIAENDLLLKTKRMKEFLESGYRVEVVLLGKRHGRKATEEEAKEVVRRVKEALGEVVGAKEARNSEGNVGRTMRMYIEKQG